MKFRSKYGYQMLYFMLTHADFAQREISRYLEIPFGATVNNFVRWVEEMGFVAQTGIKSKGGKRYQVTSPIGLISFYSKFRKMQLIDRFEVGQTRDEIIENLNKKGVTFCLSTALNQYSTYYIDPIVYAYLPKDKLYLLEEEIKEMPPGKTILQLYEFDEPDETQEKNGKKITSPVRTVIDLYCDNKAHLAEDLVKQIW